MNRSALHRIHNLPQLAHGVDYSVSALAKSCGVSVRGLERFFLAAFGCKPRQRLRQLRMEKAVKLLRDGSNVNETADHLGYHDRSHFSREFKKYYGLPPKEYTSLALKASPKTHLSHSATNLSRLATST